MTTSAPEPSPRGEGGFWTVFGTATMPTATSGASRRGEEPPDQRQNGLCSMQRPVILSPGLPPDLPDGFIRLPYRPSDRPALPTALPEALAGRVTWVILTAHLTDGFRQPDFPTSRPPDFSERPTERPTASQTGPPYRQPYLKLSPAGSHGSSLPDGFIRQTYRQVSFQRPDRPALPAARPTSPTDQPNRPARPTSPTGSLTDHPHQPSTPAKVPPAGLTGRLRSAGRRLRGWRSSRHG